MKKYYKIMDNSFNGLKTLFHANNGSKLIPMKEWVKASRYELVSDGSGVTKYMSGWHFFEDFEEAKTYLYKKFRNICDKVIVSCYICGNIRRKEHSKGNIWLAQNIYLEDIIFYHKKELNRNV